MKPIIPLLLLAVFVRLDTTLRASVVINEFMANPSGRQLTWPPSTGQPQLGSGHQVYSPEYNDTNWATGNLPAGFGMAGVSTNTQSLMMGRTPNLYLRKKFTISSADAANTQPLSLLVEAKDGFICWINGKEVARANMGPPKHFVFADQAAYQTETRTGLQEYLLGPASALLMAGENSIVIQAANGNTPATITNTNWGAPDNIFYINAGLRFVGPTIHLTAASYDFNTAAGGSLTHTNNAGAATNIQAGTPISGGWIASLSANPTSTATGNLTAAMREQVGAGIGGTGALKYDFSQTGSATALSLFAPTINMTGAWPSGGVNATSLASTTLSFRYRTTGGAVLGLQLQPTTTDSTNVINGFPTLGAAPPPPPDFDWTASTGQTLTYTFNAGTTVNTASGNTLYGFYAYGTADLSGGAFTVRADNTTPSPGGGANGVMTFNWETMPTQDAGTTNTWWGIGVQSNLFTATEWVGRTATTNPIVNADLDKAKVTFRLKLATGKRINFRIEPTGNANTFNSRCDLGNFTGTGEWVTYTRTLSSGTNLPAFLTGINASTDKRLQMSINQADGITTYTAGTLFQLDDFGVWLENSTTSSEAAPLTFANANNGYVQTSSTGTASTATTVGTPPVATSIWADPAATGYTARLIQDNTAAAGNNGSNGHLRWDLLANGAVPPGYSGFTIPGFSPQSWTPGALTQASMGLITLRLAFNLPAGETWTIWAQPTPGGTYSDRADLGTLVGTGSWQTITKEFASATNLAAFLAKLNGANSRSFDLQCGAPTSLSLGTHLRLDDIELLPWQLYSVNLATGTNPNSRFQTALNGASRVSFVPTFTRQADFAAGASMSIDNFEVVFSGSDPAQVRGILDPGSPGGAWKYFAGQYEPAGGLVDPGLLNTAFTPPVGEEEDFAKPADFVGWLELHNNGTTTEDISGWFLSDETLTNPEKWAFPPGTSIPAGGYLIVLCDNRNEANAPAGPAQRLHTNFKLSADGENVVMLDASGNFIDDIGFPIPSQVHYASYGRSSTAPANWGFLPTATPGSSNAPSIVLTDRVAPPQLFSDAALTLPISGGRHVAGPTVYASSLTPGASIRYTLDGSQPTETNGTVFPVTGLPLTRPNGRTATVLRVRAFSQAMLPSGTKTENFLINQDAAIANVPAFMMTADAGRAFYKPEGLLSIQGGERSTVTGSDTIWSPKGPDSYNVPVGRGEAYEREVNWQFYFPNGYYPNPAQQRIDMDIGIRVSSSPYTRPRLTMSNTSASPFTAFDSTEKCSWNIFFRGDFGASELDYNLFPGYTVKNFQNLRLRAGKNDIANPHISDEMFRRTFGDMGQVAPRGLVTTGYINGVYKGIYNLAERVREPMFQRHYRSENIWEIRYVDAWVDGLPIEIANNAAPPSWTQFNSWINGTGVSDWNQVQTRLDVDNFADYYLFNIYTAMWDWPWNNYVFYRERSNGPNGRWRYTTWDTEGGCMVNNYYTDYVTNQVKNQNYNSIALDLTGRNAYDLPRLFDRLRTNTEWKLRFADRVHKQLNNGGALDDRDPDAAGPNKSRLQARLDSLVAEAGPIVQYNTGQALNTAWFNIWVNPASGRRTTMLPKGTKGQPGYTPGFLRTPTSSFAAGSSTWTWANYNAADTFWPETEPPVFAPSSGNLSPGTAITISSTVAGIEGGTTVYYTLDGTDPRLAGGTVSPTALTYTAPLALNAIVTLKARARNNTTNEWSPITESNYTVDAMPASAANLVISEIMYHPADASASETAAGYNNADDFEFIRVQNIGHAPVMLTGVEFKIGIAFNFTTGSVAALNPGASVLVVRRKSAFEFRYGTSFSARIAGEFTGGLDNGGEILSLQLPGAVVVKQFAYDDAAPWPTRPDGDGPSLVLREPNANPDHALPASWISTAWPGGLVASGNTNAPLAYDQWKNLIWGPTNAAEATVSGPDADPDRDGMVNRLEYALGTNPREATTGAGNPKAMITPLGTDHFLTIEFTAASNLPPGVLTPQMSTNLAAWTGNLPQSQATPNPDGTVTYRYSAPVSIQAGQRVFIRLQVSLP